MTEESLNTYYDELGMKLGESLLTPTRIYVKPLLKLIEEVGVNGVSHITGGGFYENIPRMLHDGVKAVVNKDALEILPIFKLIQEVGGISEHDMFNTFNMGTGMVIAVDKEKAEAAVELLNACGESARIIGEIQEGEKSVELC